MILHLHILDINHHIQLIIHKWHLHIIILAFLHRLSTVNHHPRHHHFLHHMAHLNLFNNLRPPSISQSLPSLQCPATRDQIDRVNNLRTHTHTHKYLPNFLYVFFVCSKCCNILFTFSFTISFLFDVVKLFSPLFFPLSRGHTNQCTMNS